MEKVTNKVKVAQMYNTLDSILAWTDCEQLPDAANDRLEYYARLVLMIRNAARTDLMKFGE